MGDRLLCAIADVLRQVFRESDHLVRWGGEEFLVVARDMTRRQASAMAERLRAAMADMVLVLADGTRLQRTCSIGTAALPFIPSDPVALDWMQVVKLADSAMYWGKNSGRNTWVGLAAGAQAGALPAALAHNHGIPALLEQGCLRVEAAKPAGNLCWV